MAFLTTGYMASYPMIVADYLWFNSGNGIFRISLKSLNGFADGKISKVDCEAFAGLDSGEIH